MPPRKEVSIYIIRHPRQKASRYISSGKDEIPKNDYQTNKAYSRMKRSARSVPIRSYAESGSESDTVGDKSDPDYKLEVNTRQSNANISDTTERTEDDSADIKYRVDHTYVGLYILRGVLSQDRLMYTSIHQARIVGWLPASESGLEDKDGRPCAIWRIFFQKSNLHWKEDSLRDSYAEMEEYELLQSISYNDSFFHEHPFQSTVLQRTMKAANTEDRPRRRSGATGPRMEHIIPASSSESDSSESESETEYVEKASRMESKKVLDLAWNNKKRKRKRKG